MIYLIVLLMTILSIALLAMRRDRRSILIFLSCLSLSVFYFGVLVYIAKKGGISANMTLLLYGTAEIRKWMQYMVFTLGELGYMVAISRYTFPFFLILAALDMSYFEKAEKLYRKVWILAILPVVSLIVYIPRIFKMITAGNEWVTHFLVSFSKVWILGYLLLTLIVLVVEYASITLPFFKRRFVLKSLIIISLGTLYSFYALQDPAQIYMFYRNDYMWMLGLWYLSPALNQTTYILVMVGSFIFGFAGMYTLFRYVHIKFDEEREEVVIRRKAKDASEGVSMFIHGTKNELLSSQVLIERLSSQMPGSEDMELLKSINANLLARMERLNKATRNVGVKMVPVPIENLLDEILTIVHHRYPDEEIEVRNHIQDHQVLVDMELFPEAVANIIVNAVEANHGNGSKEKVLFTVKGERLWISFWISDRGKGIAKEERKHIWEPFYSSKNSSKNWGMGMYYTWNIIRSHMGSVRFEAREGGGTRFIILLPRLEKRGLK